MLDSFGFIEFDSIDSLYAGVVFPAGFSDWYLNSNDCDGCGTKWFSGLVPDSIYFLNIKLACCIHDFMFSLGGTREDFEYANAVFKDNMNALIRLAGATYLLYPTRLAMRRAETYYKAVSTDYAYKVFKDNNTKVANVN